MPDKENIEQNSDEMQERLIACFQDQLGDEPPMTPESRLYQKVDPIIERVRRKPTSIYERVANRLLIIGKGLATGEFFNKQNALEKIDGILKSLEHVRDELASLPFHVNDLVELVCKERIEARVPGVFYSGTLTFENSRYSKHFPSFVSDKPASELIAVLIELFEEIPANHALYFKGGNQDKPDRDSIRAQIEKMDFLRRDLANETRSQKRIIKSQIVDELRYFWQDVKGEEAAKSVPYEGNEFGDLVQVVFDVLGIKGNARAAVDAWREEFIHNSRQF